MVALAAEINDHILIIVRLLQTETDIMTETNHNEDGRVMNDSLVTRAINW